MPWLRAIVRDALIDFYRQNSTRRAPFGEHEADGTIRDFGDLSDVIIEGATRRIRPKLMTVVAMTAGLLPLLWSTGTGADVMKRVVAPMVGGPASTFALELLVYPALFAVWNRRSLPRPGSANRALPSAR